MRFLARRAAAPIACFLAALFLWEAAVTLFDIPFYVLPPPSTIATTAIREAATLGRHTLITLGEALLGFALANSLGFLAAVAFAHSRAIRTAFFPYAIALKTTPIVAIAPLLVVWFGSGFLSKVIAAALVAFFPIVVSATRGFQAIDREALDLFASLRASRWQVFYKLRLPTALPFVFSALKISSSLSVVGAIVGEFVGAQRGLGYLIILSSYHLEVDMMFAAGLSAAVAGVAFFVAIDWLEKLLVPWARGID